LSDIDRLAPLMERALALAERGGGATAPNPMVGCVIADSGGRVLGEGYHRRAGGPHAEVEALRAVAAAGHDPHGSTVVVTLEPCAHQGLTPACVDALIEAGVARVAFATEDPHTGRGGAGRLVAAGIPAAPGLLRREAELLVEPWLHFVRHGRPLFHLKTAVTLNGRVTRGAGGPRWITGPEARAAVHRLRRRHAAVVVGIGTALADDPLLTVRDWPPPGGPPDDSSPLPWPDVQPLRVVLDAELRLPLDSRMARTARDAPVLVLCAEDAPRDREAALGDHGVEVLRVPRGPTGLALDAAALALADREVTGALVEPGPTLARGLLASGLVDRWTFFVAPVWEAARDAVPLLDGLGLELRDPVWETHGPDASVSGRLA